MRPSTIKIYLKDLIRDYKKHPFGSVKSNELRKEIRDNMEILRKSGVR